MGERIMGFMTYGLFALHITNGERELFLVDDYRIYDDKDFEIPNTKIDLFWAIEKTRCVVRRVTICLPWCRRL